MPEQDLSQLIDMLRHGDSKNRDLPHLGKCAAAKKIAEMGPAARDAVPALLEALDDRWEATTWAVLEALEAIGREAGAALSRLQEEWWQEVRRAYKDDPYDLNRNMGRAQYYWEVIEKVGGDPASMLEFILAKREDDLWDAAFAVWYFLPDHGQSFADRLPEDMAKVIGDYTKRWPD